MKSWLKQDEWMGLANCFGDDRFTAESLSREDVSEVLHICQSCITRPECMAWAIREEAASVVVAGIRLPDPEMKRTLRRIYRHFKAAIPGELKARGDL